MEIALRLRADFYRRIRPYNGSLDECLCVEELQKKVHLPKRIPKIYAVFSKKKMPDAFRIQLVSGNSHKGRVVGFVGSMPIATQWRLSKEYDNGYRYVRIEY